jgi:GDP-L-fucose synthase
LKVDKNKNKVFITGGNGMVGKNILCHPLSSKWDFFAPTRKELDLTNFDLLVEYIGNVQPDFIIHTAGHIGGINASVNNPVDFFLRNLDIGRNVVVAAHQVGVKRLINLGSSCMYPRNAPNPLSEDMILKGELEDTNEGYALAKISIQRLCEYINTENNKFEYKTIIPCNLYGCYDKFDPYRAHLIPAIITKLHHIIENEGTECEIWGDGLARREFMYTGDFADAILYALDNFNSMPSLLNIGTGVDYTIEEYYSIVANLMNYNGTFTLNTNKPVGMHQKLVSIEKQTAWGWRPKVSLIDGIQNTYNCYLQGKIYKDNEKF